MTGRIGRFEKRIQLEVPVQIFSLLDPSVIERTITENVCSSGIRILTRRAKERNDRFMVRSQVGNLRTLARVVYCQRLADGRFGVGLQFQEAALNWTSSTTTGAAD